MRTMLKFSIPVEMGNLSIGEGRLPVILEQTIARLNPEASYFFAEQGRRTAMIVFDLANPSDIPVIAEPLFTGLNAAVELHPVMNWADLRKAFDSLGAATAGAPSQARPTASK